ncbi:hypothetical protein BC828DRAFT_421211 [Blastocladiella britannica]|nr:hypothetical protein BC828DRAFT_421211 [Blastocladiella britannica]
MQGFNKYFPKDFDPKKHRSVNQHLGVHPLGKRASKLESDGVLVVRFEMPFNIWCGHCAKPIGKGVRYNAQKKAVGKYLSTVIWGFRCKCHLCSGWFEIRTDPKNAEYVCHEGARRKVETYEPEDAGVMKLTNTARDEAEATNADPLARLDRDARDAAVAQANREEIERLMDVSDARWGDDFSMNQAMRRKFRVRTQSSWSIFFD